MFWTPWHALETYVLTPQALQLAQVTSTPSAQSDTRYVPAGHWLHGLHTASATAEHARTWYCPTGQTLQGAQVASAVAEHSPSWYLPVGQLAQSAQAVSPPTDAYLPRGQATHGAYVRATKPRLQLPPGVPALAVQITPSALPTRLYTAPSRALAAVNIRPGVIICMFEQLEFMHPYSAMESSGPSDTWPSVTSNDSDDSDTCTT